MTSGPSVGGNFSDAMKTAVTGNDGKMYMVPWGNYPWVVMYRKSVFEDKGYTVPTTWDEFMALADQMKTDGLIPLAFADKDGWPAMGTFDILNMRVNGYKFHVDLMAGNEKWTDPRVTAVFEAWKKLLPVLLRWGPRPDLAGRRPAADDRPAEGRHVLPGHVRDPAGGRSRPSPRTSTSSRSRRSAPSSTASWASTPRSTGSR